MTKGFYLRRFMVQHIVVLLVVSFITGAFGSACRSRADNNPSSAVAAASPAPLVIPTSDGFDYPVGATTYVTQANDRDDWYNAQDFGVNDHLGEDWNAKTGGNTDCGMPVYAASIGKIAFAGEAGPGWGKVVIIRHKLPDGTLVETLYGHLQSFARTSGDVGRRERIGSIGDGDGAYPCHLHFELRSSDCPAWGEVGTGYAKERRGWVDPSNYIDARRSLK